MYIRECPVVLMNILLPSSGLNSKPTGVAVSEVRSVTTYKSGSFVSWKFPVLYLAGTLGKHNSTVGCYRYKCDDDGYFRLQRAHEIKQSQPRATRALNGSSRYNLRRVSGMHFEVTVSEDEDDHQMQQA
jgi:hypothetical protein